MALFVSGPPACGKSRNAKTLARHFGCHQIVDSWEPGDQIVPGALHLTTAPPPAGYQGYAFSDLVESLGLEEITEPVERAAGNADAGLELLYAVVTYCAQHHLKGVDAEAATASFTAYLTGKARLIYEPDPDCPRACLRSERTLRIIEQAARAGNPHCDPDTIYDLVCAAGEANAARSLRYTVTAAAEPDQIDDADIPF